MLSGTRYLYPWQSECIHATHECLRTATGRRHQMSPALHVFARRQHRLLSRKVPGSLCLLVRGRDRVRQCQRRGSPSPKATRSHPWHMHGFHRRSLHRPTPRACKGGHIPESGSLGALLCAAPDCRVSSGTSVAPPSNTAALRECPCSGFHDVAGTGQMAMRGRGTASPSCPAPAFAVLHKHIMRPCKTTVMPLVPAHETQEMMLPCPIVCLGFDQIRCVRLNFSAQACLSAARRREGKRR